MEYVKKILFVKLPLPCMKGCSLRFYIENNLKSTLFSEEWCKDVKLFKRGNLVKLTSY